MGQELVVPNGLPIGLDIVAQAELGYVAARGNGEISDDQTWGELGVERLRLATLRPGKDVSPEAFDALRRKVGDLEQAALAIPAVEPLRADFEQAWREANGAPRPERL